MINEEANKNNGTADSPTSVLEDEVFKCFSLPLFCSFYFVHTSSQ